MSRAIYIWGPESTGTRLLKSVFLMNGFDGGSDHEEKWGNKITDYRLPDDGNIVWRFSVPMGDEWPALTKAIDMGLEKQFDVKVLVTTRDWNASLASQKRHHRGSVDRVRQAYKVIFAALSARPAVSYWIISYEQVIHLGEHYLPMMFPDIQFVRFPELFDGNAKYYE